MISLHTDTREGRVSKKTYLNLAQRGIDLVCKQLWGRGVGQMGACKYVQGGEGVWALRLHALWPLISIEMP